MPIGYTTVMDDKHVDKFCSVDGNESKIKK